MSNRQRQVIALMLGVFLAVMMVNATLLAVYTGAVLGQTAPTAVHDDTCGLQKTVYAAAGYVVYSNGCNGETLAYYETGQ